MHDRQAAIHPPATRAASAAFPGAVGRRVEWFGRVRLDTTELSLEANKLSE
jgi:hypothetical protein